MDNTIGPLSLDDGRLDTMNDLQPQPAGTPVEIWSMDYTYSPLMRRLPGINLTRSAGIPNPLWQRFTYDEDAANEPQGILTQHRIEELGSATLQLDVDTDLAYVNERDQVAQYSRAWETGGAGTNWHNVYDADGTVVARWYVDSPVIRACCYDYDGQGALHRAREVTWTGATPPEFCVDSDPNMTEVRRVEYLIDPMGRRMGRRTYTAGALDSGSEIYWAYRDGLNPVAQLDASGRITQHDAAATFNDVRDSHSHSDGVQGGAHRRCKASSSTADAGSAGWRREARAALAGAAAATDPTATPPTA